MATDAFFVAFKLPTCYAVSLPKGHFPRHLYRFWRNIKEQGEDATRVFVSYVSGLLTLALAVVTVAGMLAAPWVIMVTAPGFADTADKFALTSQLLRLPFPILADLPGVAGGSDLEYVEPLLDSGVCSNTA